MNKTKIALLCVVSMMIGGFLVYFLISSQLLKVGGEEILFETQRPDMSDQLMSLEDIMLEHENLEENLDSLFDDEFFGQGNPFEEMKRFREKLREQMEDRTDSDQGLKAFDDWFGGRFGGGSLNEINQREDDKYVYYEIVIKDVNSTNVKASVEGDYLSITGETVSKNGSGSVSSSITRSFPLPGNAKAESMQMLPEDGKLLVRFEKE